MAFAVTLAIRAKAGQAVKAFDRLTKKADKFGSRSEKAFRRASKSAASFRSITGGVLAANAISRATGLAAQGVRGLTEEVVTFDDATTQAAAKFPEQIRRGTREFNKLGQTARDVGAATKFTATEAAEGLNFLAMAGFNSTQAMAALAPAAELAVVANTDFARATDIATDTLGAFGLKVDDSVQLTKNMTRVNDVMAKTVTTANTDLEQLFETMKFAGPAARGAGASIETFAALTGTMANTGIKASMAGTSMRQMFLKLADPPKEAAKMLRKLNVEVQDENKNFHDITNIIDQLNKSFVGMGTAQRTAAIATIFGARAVSGISALLDKGGQGLRDYRAQLELAGGTAKTMADEINKSLGNRLKALQSAAVEVGLSFVDAFGGPEAIANGINKLVTAVRKFDVDEFLTRMNDIKLLIIDLMPIIKGIAVAFAFVKIVQGIQAVGAALSLLAANPVVAVIAGIATLAVLIIQNWTPIKAFFIDTWNGITEAYQYAWAQIKIGIDAAWGWFSGLLDNPFFTAVGLLLAPWVTIPALIIKHWDAVKLFFTTLWEDPARAFKMFLNGIIGGINKVKNFLGFEGGDIGLFDTGPTAPNAAQPQLEAPNRAAIQREGQQRIINENRGFYQLDINGAPSGSKFSGKSSPGSVPLRSNLAGANP
jgi:TP901 family phage tail tape measure protein